MKIRSFNAHFYLLLTSTCSYTLWVWNHHRYLCLLFSSLTINPFSVDFFKLFSIQRFYLRLQIRRTKSTNYYTNKVKCVGLKCTIFFQGVFCLLLFIEAALLNRLYHTEINRWIGIHYNHCKERVRPARDINIYFFGTKK